MPMIRDIWLCAFPVSHMTQGGGDRSQSWDGVTTLQYVDKWHTTANKLYFAMKIKTDFFFLLKRELLCPYPGPS